MPGCSWAATPGPVNARTPSDAIRNLVKPAGYRFKLGDSPRFATKYDESRLKGVFGVVRVGQQTPAHGPHHPLLLPYEKAMLAVPASLPR
jgi:hypothetical protein